MLLTTLTPLTSLVASAAFIRNDILPCPTSPTLQSLLSLQGHTTLSTSRHSQIVAIALHWLTVHLSYGSTPGRDNSSTLLSVKRGFSLATAGLYVLIDLKICVQDSLQMFERGEKRLQIGQGDKKPVQRSRNSAPGLTKGVPRQAFLSLFRQYM